MRGILQKIMIIINYTLKIRGIRQKKINFSKRLVKNKLGIGYNGKAQKGVENFLN